MQTQKQRDKEKNAKIQLINLVSTINLLAFLINSIHKVYKNYTHSLIRLLCCAVVLEADRGYFYRKDLYNMLTYAQGSFENLFNFNIDCFIVLDDSTKFIKYKLSLKGSELLYSFYTSFIEQLSNSL